jgi:uncharacterized membrane protein HdeD (DUF308 family)
MEIQDKDNDKRLETFVGVKDLHKNWGWFLTIGILLMILGMFAVTASTLTTLATMVVLGSLLVAGGVIQGVNAIKTRHGRGFLVNLLAALLYCVTGILVLIHPEIGAITLTLLLSAFYTVSGLFKIVAAFVKRYAHWGWLAFSGFVSLALGLMIWAQWPVSGLWVIGLFVGVDLIIVGWLWIVFAIAVKDNNLKLPPTPPNRSL